VIVTIFDIVQESVAGISSISPPLLLV